MLLSPLVSWLVKDTVVLPLSLIKIPEAMVVFLTGALNNKVIVVAGFTPLYIPEEFELLLTSELLKLKSLGGGGGGEAGVLPSFLLQEKNINKSPKTYADFIDRMFFINTSRLKKAAL